MLLSIAVGLESRDSVLRSLVDCRWLLGCETSILLTTDFTDPVIRKTWCLVAGRGTRQTIAMVTAVAFTTAYYQLLKGKKYLIKTIQKYVMKEPLFFASITNPNRIFFGAFEQNS